MFSRECYGRTEIPWKIAVHREYMPIANCRAEQQVFQEAADNGKLGDGAFVRQC